MSSASLVEPLARTLLAAWGQFGPRAQLPLELTAPRNTVGVEIERADAAGTSGVFDSQTRLPVNEGIGTAPALVRPKHTM